MVPGVLDVSRYGVHKVFGGSAPNPVKELSCYFFRDLSFCVHRAESPQKKALRQFGGLMSERDSD